MVLGVIKGLVNHLPWRLLLCSSLLGTCNHQQNNYRDLQIVGHSTYLVSSPIISWNYTQLVGDSNNPPTLYCSPQQTSSVSQLSVGCYGVDTPLVNPRRPLFLLLICDSGRTWLIIIAHASDAQWYINQNNFLREVSVAIFNLTRIFYLAPRTARDVADCHWLYIGKQVRDWPQAYAADRPRGSTGKSLKGQACTIFGTSTHHECCLEMKNNFCLQYGNEHRPNTGINVFHGKWVINPLIPVVLRSEVWPWCCNLLLIIFRDGIYWDHLFDLDGSDRFMGDLVLNGGTYQPQTSKFSLNWRLETFTFSGKYGMFVGNQQFTVRNIAFNNTLCAVF